MSSSSKPLPPAPVATKPVSKTQEIKPAVPVPNTKPIPIHPNLSKTQEVKPLSTTQEIKVKPLPSSPVPHSDSPSSTAAGKKKAAANSSLPSTPTERPKPKSAGNEKNFVTIKKPSTPPPLPARKTPNPEKENEKPKDNANSVKSPTNVAKSPSASNNGKEKEKPEEPNVIADLTGTEEASSSSSSSNLQAVTVIVRARPMNEREKAENSEDMCTFNGLNSITINPSANKDGDKSKAKQFTFDRVFPPKSTQEEVYNETASKLLKKITDGYNGCVFAYGQTGSGKTYTMEGSTTDPGIMKRLGQDLFKTLSAQKNTEFVIRASYLEIYLEHLEDLMAKYSKIPSDTLRIREDPVKGVFVQNLVKFPLNSENDLAEMIENGTKFRKKGETMMNAVSSRSHAVLTLWIHQEEKDDEFSKKQSKLHLIDLAGSERAKDTQATGERLMEGAKINQSLSVLGNVINALALKKGHIPYRDSKLTRLLTDSLGGNSVTLMFVNISPAAINYEETLSSLQFADRAKQIKNKIAIARDPKLAKIAELIEENKKLKEEIEKLRKEKGFPPGLYSTANGAVQYGEMGTITTPNKKKGACCSIQ